MGGFYHLVYDFVLGTALRGERKHGHARVFESGHAPGGLGCADGNLCQLLGVGHGGDGNVAYHEHTLLAVLRRLGDEQHGAADAGDAGGALNDLQGGPEGIACGGEGTADLSVGIAALDDEATEVQRIEHLLPGLLLGHALGLAQFVEQRCIIVGLGAGLGVDDGGLLHVLQTQFLGLRQNFLAVADEDDFGQLVGYGAVGSGQCALLQRFGEHDALFVALGSSNDFVDECHSGYFFRIN